MAALGITRLANITGLDYLGVPVFIAVRPNGRSLSVAQGKGLDVASARVSALMEAVEFAHAEAPGLTVRRAAYAELKKTARVADPKRLAQQKGTVFRPDDEISWVQGKLWNSDEQVWVPYDLVHLDFTDPPRNSLRKFRPSRGRVGASGFLTSSNGLASGNTNDEALCAALCELIERDATALWRHRGESEKAQRRIALASVDDDINDPGAAALLAQLAARGMDVTLWDVTSDVGIATVLCRLREAPGHARSRLGAFWGSGCHPTAGIALTRAVTEAVQSRLGFISGSRDDLHAADYEEPAAPALLAAVRDAMAARRKAKSFARVPSVVNRTFAEDLAHLAKALARVGMDEIVTVDLTRAEFGIPVMRAIVPGLEGVADHGLCKPGARARALRAER